MPDITKRYAAIIMIIVFLPLLLALPAVAYVAGEVRKMNDNFCPEGTYWQNYFNIKSDDSSVVLIDTSNAIPGKDGEVAFNNVVQWVRTLPPFEKISIRGLPETPNGKSSFDSDSWCVAWSKGTAPKLFTGGLVVERNFQHKFLPKVRRAFDEAINLPEADESPILETLSALKKEGVRSVFLVSDMMQNVRIGDGAESHYEPILLCDEQCAYVKGLNLNVYYIKRAEVRYPPNHKDIWARHFNSQEIEWHSGE